MNLNVLKVKAERLYADIEEYLNDQYPEGAVTKWVKGPRKGRECKIVGHSWDVTHDGIDIRLLVRTKSLKGNKFLANDKYDKYFTELEYFANPNTFKVLYDHNRSIEKN